MTWQRLFSNLGREVEFFYDRRILGFDSLDQVRVIEAVRQALADAGHGLASWRDLLRGRQVRDVGAAAAILLLAAAVFAVARRAIARSAATAPTRAYVALRCLLAARLGALSPAVPPFEVARLFQRHVPAGHEDARRVVAIYCASAFGGRPLSRADEQDLKDSLMRIKRLA
jgi:hypothetical protein